MTMHKRRSLFVNGVLLSALVLFGPTTASAQVNDVQIGVVNVVPAGYGALQITWTLHTTDTASMAQESNITGYEVRYQEGASLNNAEPFDVVEVSNTQTHRLEDLEHGTAYIVQVRAIDDDDTTGNGSGNWGTIGGESETTITASDPDQVDDLELESGDGMITATWDPADGNDFDIIGYVVEIMPEDGNWDVMNIGDVTEHTFTGLMNGTEYSVRVSATSEIGTGIPSSIEEETPMADDTMIPTLDAPMPTLGTPTHDSVMVSWAAVEGATSYSVNWTANGVTTSAPVGMAMEHNIANLTPETMYSVSVCAQAEGMHDDGCPGGPARRPDADARNADPRQRHGLLGGRRGRDQLQR
jgi:hypothetical protein